MQAMERISLGWVFCACLLMTAPTWAAGPLFDGLVLVDEINCGSAGDPHPVAQYPSNASSFTTILGRPCRRMNPGSSARYFAYRIGAGQIQAGKAYILTVDYPEDQPRAMFVTNAGAMTTGSIHTGTTLGNAFDPPYIMQDRESLNLPLTGQWETWQQFFHLHERFAGIKEPRGAATLPDNPTTGFYVTIMQYKQADEPTSVGAAVSHIRLYEAPDMATYTQPLNLPPAGLPQRHLFWREEMADIPAVDGSSVSTRAVTNELDWYEYKARLMKFLGMNTFSKDLLEFGANQGWDSTPYGGDDWVYMGRFPWLWEDIVQLMGSYGLNVLPYYEYAGSKGVNGLGFERRPRPLTNPDGNLNYTHISWTETARADVTYAPTLTDLTKMLDCTIARFKNDANFIGAWIRPRSSQMPVSFSDDALARFATEANGGVSIMRSQLSSNQTLYDSYIAWWQDVRHDFLDDVRDYLRAEGISQAVVLNTWDPAEGGAVYPDWGRPEVITDVPATWQALGKTTKTLSQAIAEHYHWGAQSLPPLTWSAPNGTWEWNHAVPRPDVANYQTSDGVMFTHTVNMAYTVGDSYSLDQFRTASGMAIVKHYMLNENAPDDNQNGLVGYFVVSVNMPGPYTMLTEARAMAYGDPRYIGYLASESYNRGFPQYVRNFNAAFLALPALPSIVLSGAASDPNVVVRAINAGQHGTYLAVVNVGYTDADDVVITLPETGYVTDAATGEVIPVAGGQITLSLYPCQLRAIRVEDAAPPLMGDFNGDGTVSGSDYVLWANNFGGSDAVFAPGTHNGDGTVTGADYVTWADNFGATQ